MFFLSLFSQLNFSHIKQQKNNKSATYIHIHEKSCELQKGMCVEELFYSFAPSGEAFDGV